MSVELVPCAGCNRHIYADEPTCPFCHRAPVRGTAAGKAMVVALSAGLSLVACRATEGPPAVYGGPPPPLEPAQPTSTATSAVPSEPTSSATTAPTAPAPTASTTPKTKTTTTPPRREPKPLYGMPPAGE